MESISAIQSTTREDKFVRSVIKQCALDNGFSAKLKRADNPATEYQCWEVLVSHGVNLTWENQRLPYALISAAIARAKPEKNGTLSLGRAIALCYPEDRDSEPAKARLRRLLACGDIPELCRILRPIFSLIESRVTQSLDFYRILKQLCLFSLDEHVIKIKAQWAQEFYGHDKETDKTEAAV